MSRCYQPSLFASFSCSGACHFSVRIDAGGSAAKRKGNTFDRPDLISVPSRFLSLVQPFAIRRGRWLLRCSSFFLRHRSHSILTASQRDITDNQWGVVDVVIEITHLDLARRPPSPSYSFFLLEVIPSEPASVIRTVAPPTGPASPVSRGETASATSTSTKNVSTDRPSQGPEGHSQALAFISQRGAIGRPGQM